MCPICFSLSEIPNTNAHSLRSSKYQSTCLESHDKLKHIGHIAVIIVLEAIINREAYIRVDSDSHKWDTLSTAQDLSTEWFPVRVISCDSWIVVFVKEKQDGPRSHTNQHETRNHSKLLLGQSFRPSQRAVFCRRRSSLAFISPSNSAAGLISTGPSPYLKPGACDIS